MAESIDVNEQYPSHEHFHSRMINRRPLELTDADLVITLDDEGRRGLKDRHGEQPMLGPKKSTRPSFLSDAPKAKTTEDARTCAHALAPHHLPTSKSLAVAASGPGPSGQQQPKPTEESRQRYKLTQEGLITAEHITTFNNICQHLFCQGGLVAISEDPSRQEAVAWVRDPRSQRIIRLGYARGVSKLSARASAAIEACIWLQKLYPNNISTYRDNNFVLVS
ncbi:hypothetical protein BKA70DRAFT_598830 [Coprinopsis sp. MPI-PUGE-AT-0042]|nr:hypothetical protein BKA70DRAFT_598830 [Coprinopsis sp. MPI-PUGE-AT-0042]